MEEIYIFGHRRPDTDAVTSSIALSYLKNQLGINAKPVILDNISTETEFVLKYFGVKVPEFINDVKLKIKDIEYYKDYYVTEDTSILKTYNYIKEKNVTGVPVVSENKKLLGLVTLKTIGNEIICDRLNNLLTSYLNIIETLEGKEILKYNDEINGNILVAAYGSKALISNVKLNKDTILIVGNRLSIIEYAIKSKIKLLILVGGQEIPDEYLELAKQNKVNIILTNYDTFHTAKLIGLSAYIKTLLGDARIEKVHETDYFDTFMELSSRKGFNNYPVVNEKDECAGLIRLTDIKKKNKLKVILVDHNEMDQSATGIEEAEIIEIVDHHKIGDFTTSNPINFRNMIVGSTNTIVYMMYKEARVEIPKQIAGIMFSGIISDTLNFTSPTTTEIDKTIATELAKIADIDKDKYAMKMFKAGTNIKGKTKEEIITADLKVFPIENKKMGIAQIFTLSSDEILLEKEKYIEVIEKVKEEKQYSNVIVYLTDIVRKGSYVLYDIESERLVKDSMELDKIKQGTYMDGILSRKQQIVPKIMQYVRR